MAKAPELKIEVAKVIFFFPVAKFVSIGDVACLRIFGIPVYQRVGYVKKILWYKWDVLNLCECSNCRYTREFGGFMDCLNRKPSPMPECKPPKPTEHQNLTRKGYL